MKNNLMLTCLGLLEFVYLILPFGNLSEFIQEAICSSLEDYNKQIEQLKEEMNDATHGADNIRKDISALAQRCTVIDRDEECGVLTFLITCLTKPHLLFFSNCSDVELCTIIILKSHSKLFSIRLCRYAAEKF